MDAETREALDVIRSPRSRGWERVVAANRIEQTLRDLSELAENRARYAHEQAARMSALAEEQAKKESVLAGAWEGYLRDELLSARAERDALAERVERAERERDEALRAEDVAERHREAAEAEAARLRPVLDAARAAWKNDDDFHKLVAALREYDRDALSPPTDGEAT